MTDDLFTPLTGPTRNGGSTRRHRHRWVWTSTLDDNGRQVQVRVCRAHVPPVVADPAVSRRARTNRSRGLAIQRKRNRELGITNIAGNAPNHDGGTHRDLFVSESKSGGAFSERYWRWLSGIPAEAGQVRILIVTEAPGPGRRARSYVVVDFDDWRDLHGGER